MPDYQRQQSLIDQIVDLLASGRPLSVQFEHFCAIVSGHFDVSVVFIALAQSDGSTRVEYALDHGIRRFPGLAIAEQTTTAEVMRSGQSVLRMAAAEWVGFERAPLRGEDPSSDDSVSALFVPIFAGERTIGVISLQSPRERAYDRADCDLVETVARLLGDAIQTQRPTLHGDRRTSRAYTASILAGLVGLTIAIVASLLVSTANLRERAIVDQRARTAAIDHSLTDVLNEAREIATNLGALVPMVPKTRAAVERLAKELLDAAPGTAIDGVGLWWKPYAFDPQVERYAPYVARIKDRQPATHVVYKYQSRAYDYLHRSFYLTGLHAHGVAFNPPYSENGFVFFGAATPIRERTGAIVGVATSDVFGGDFAAELGLTSLPPLEFAYVTAADGRIVASTDDRALRRFTGASTKTAISDLPRGTIRHFLDKRLGNTITESAIRATSGLVVHLVASDAALFAQADGLRGAAIVVIVIIWILGAGILALDVRQRRGGRRALNLEREKLELENEIAERQRAEERLRRFAFYDALTDLPNRAFLFEHMTRALERGRVAHDPFAVLYIDLDRFKIVNDSLGHAVGDELLVAVARRLASSLQANDIVARIGGDEFVVVLHHIEGGDDARGIAQRIIERMSEAFVVRESDLYTGASIGIVANAHEYASPSDLLRDADVAMYEAKGKGKDRFVLFDRALHTRTVAQLRLETDLRGAVDRNEFVLRYQPIIELATGRLAGFEALVRWQHPERGLLGPTEFIAISEQNRSVLRLGSWVAREAIREFCTWDRRDLTISINVSVRQLVQNNFASDIAGMLVAAGMDARALKIEITESALMEDVETSARALRELRELGVQAHIDDFGTGYSSLSYLRRFPIESIKIDRSFVAEMTHRSEAFEIIRTIVTLASTLGLSVTAEGIETAEQLAACTSLGITYGQGYYIAYPLEPLEAAENAKRSLPASLAQ